MKDVLSISQHWLRGQVSQHLQRRDVIALLVLAIVGVMLTLHAPTIFFGARVLLGPCCSLLAFLLYRSYWGIAVAIPSSLATVALFGDALTAIRLIGEMVFVTWLCRGSSADKAIRYGRVIRYVVLYAIVVGCPFLFLTEVFLEGTQVSIALTLVYKNFVTSVFNALVAYALYSWLELRRNRRIQGSSHQISLKTLTSVLIMLTCILMSYWLITKEFVIASERAQMLVLQRNYSFASLLMNLQSSSPIVAESELPVPLEQSVKGLQSGQMLGLGGGFDRTNEYDIVNWNGRNRLVKPKGEGSVWYQIRVGKEGTPLRYKNAFFDHVLPQLSPYEKLRLISSDLLILAPREGSDIDRLRGAYWKYVHQGSFSGQPFEIQVYASTSEFINGLSEVANTALSRLAEVVIAALVLSSLISNRLTKEWSAILPQGGGDFDLTVGDPSVDDVDSPYNQSPVYEIDYSVNQINARTSRIVASKKKIEALNAIAKRQMATAAEIQSFFLAKDFPQGHSYDVAAMTKSAYEVGGDWYDAFTIDQHSFFVVADVCDKAIGSALFMSVFRTLIRTTTTNVFDAGARDDDASQGLVDVLSEVNRYMSINHGESMYFATVFFAHVSDTEDQLSYVSAGHESVMLNHGDHSHALLPATGPALGLFPDAVYQCASHRFAEGDVLLAYSDGVTDARNERDESFSAARLKAYFDQVHQQSVFEMRDQLYARLIEYMNGAEQFDDITIMFVKRTRPQLTP